MRIKWIDSLRGYGAICVVLCHIVQALKKSGGEEGFFFDYLLNGARAVQMFFMITGLTTFFVLDSKTTNVIKYYKKR